MFKFSLIPRETIFFDIFDKSAQNVLDCSIAFHELMENYQDVSAKVDKVIEFENRGDSLTHETIEVLNRTFVTPLDREDIFRLAESLDDVLDQIEDAASRLILFDIQKPTQYAVELAHIIMQACKQINTAIPALRNLKQLPALRDNLLQIHTLENRADTVKKFAIRELFQHPEDLISIMKWREIYEHLEAATDRCEDVADVLQGLLVKHA